jgi:iron complex outermembrane receptor protein
MSRNLVVTGGVSYVAATKAMRPGENIFSTRIVEMPPLRARSAIRYGRSAWFAEIEGIAAGRQDRIDTDLSEKPTPGYALVNLRFGVRARRVSFRFGMDNVANRYYCQHLSYQRDLFRSGDRLPEPGRSLSVSVLYAF